MTTNPSTTRCRVAATLGAIAALALAGCTSDPAPTTSTSSNSSPTSTSSTPATSTTTTVDQDALDAAAAVEAVRAYWDTRIPLLNGESNDLNGLAEFAQDNQLDLDQMEIQKFRASAVMVGDPVITVKAAHSDGKGGWLVPTCVDLSKVAYTAPDGGELAEPIDSTKDSVEYLVKYRKVYNKFFVFDRVEVSGACST